MEMTDFIGRCSAENVRTSKGKNRAKKEKCGSTKQGNWYRPTKVYITQKEQSIKAIEQKRLKTQWGNVPLDSIDTSIIERLGS